jgi:adenosine deaminase
MARNSIEYSFLPGNSLWADHDYGRPNAACATSLRAHDDAERRCAAYLTSNPKAQQQWELERRFQRFEEAQDGANQPPAKGRPEVRR